MSEHEDRPAVDVEAFQRVFDQDCDHLAWAQLGGMCRCAAASALLAEHAALREEVERNQSIYEGALEQTVSTWRTRTEAAIRNRDNIGQQLLEAIERADRLQRVVDGAREWAELIEQEVMDRQDECDQRSDCGPCWQAETAQQFRLALLPDDEGGAK